MRYLLRGRLRSPHRIKRVEVQIYLVQILLFTKFRVFFKARLVVLAEMRVKFLDIARKVPSCVVAQSRFLLTVSSVSETDVGNKRA